MPEPQSSPPPRRDVLMLVALSFCGVGALAAAWPLIAQMAPNPGSPAPEVATVDLDGIESGATRTVAWRGNPVMVRHRTRAEIDRAHRSNDLALRDRLARHPGLDPKALAIDANRTNPMHPQWLVVIGLCTHTPCLLRDFDLAARLDDGIGWFCPCCASRYDLSGRVLSGPAPQNLAIPPFVIAGRRLQIGAS